MTRYYIIILLLLFGGCQETLFEETEPSDVKNNFEVFWTELDRNYAYFDFKNINWDSVYSSNIVKISSEQDLKDALYDVVQFLRYSILFTVNFHNLTITECQFIISFYTR